MGEGGGGLTLQYTKCKMQIIYLSSKFSVAVELISLRKKLKWNKNILSYNFNIIYKLYTTKSWEGKLGGKHNL